MNQDYEYNVVMKTDEDVREEKITLLQSVEKIFSDKMSKSLEKIYGDNSGYYQANQNICCDELDEVDIITMGDIIIKDEKFNMLNLKDIYILF